MYTEASLLAEIARLKDLIRTAYALLDYTEIHAEDAIAAQDVLREGL